MTTTAGNFLRAVVFASLLSIVGLPWARLDRAGVGYAVLSGAIASGVGYVIWYSALPGLKAASAATVQLSVPVLAAAGGILFLGESITVTFSPRIYCRPRRNRARRYREYAGRSA